MTNVYYERTTCRLCLSTDPRVAIPLEPTPMGDKYVPYERRHEVEGTIPLAINMCADCGHLQDSVVVNPDLLYPHYLSRPAAVNPVLSDAYQRYAEDLLRRFAPADGGLAVELGSNDGIFSRFLQDRGMKALGVEPALNLAAQATAVGVETIPQLFSSKLAEQIKAQHGKADIMVGNHMVANIDDMVDAIKGVRELLAPAGVFSMQTFYMVDVLQKNLLENFTFEHLSCFNVKPLKSFCDRNGMKLFEVQRVPAKEGSIRCFIEHADGPHPVSSSVAELIALEDSLGMNKTETYKSISAFIDHIRESLHGLLGDSRTSGKTFAAYGTSIGATTFTAQYRLGNVLKFFVDDDPYRQNLVSPGYHIPVMAPDELLKQRPDYVIILAPLYAEAIMKKNQAYLDSGGAFVRIWPDFQVVKGTRA